MGQWDRQCHSAVHGLLWTHKDMSQVVFLRLTKTNLNTSTDIRTDMKLEYDMSSRSEESHLSETVVKNLYH